MLKAVQDSPHHPSSSTASSPAATSLSGRPLAASSGLGSAGPAGTEPLTIATIHAHLATACQELQNLSQFPPLLQAISQALQLFIRSYQKKGALFAAGNGGSACDAQHLIAELVGRFSRERTPLRGFALTADMAILTAIGNDYGFDHVFSRQIQANMNPEQDVFLAISTSGNSPNILRALETCQKLGIPSVLLSGPTGGKAAALAQVNLLVPGSCTARVQEGHIVVYHLLCQLLEAELQKLGLCSFLD